MKTFYFPLVGALAAALLVNSALKGGVAAAKGSKTRSSAGAAATAESHSGDADGPTLRQILAVKQSPPPKGAHRKGKG